MPRLLTHALAVVGGFYALRSIDTLRGWDTVVPDRARTGLPSLSIVVPARNEERSIERCVRSLFAQSGVDLDVTVVDDRSTDATPAILAALQTEFPALRVVAGAPLPDGWVGKPWACAQGARDARGTWLLFTDADTVHESLAARSTLACALDANVDLLSLMTGQVLGTFAERAILPTILALVVFASGTIAELNDPARPDRALANGQYLLVSRHAYDALGGHDALRAEIVEDLEFARRLKTDGRFRMRLVEATALVRVRMYRSFREIWDGFTKNSYLGARGDVRALGGGAAFCFALSVAPPIAAAFAMKRGRWGEAAEALAVTGIVVGVAVMGARRVNLPASLALLSPIGLATFGAIMVNSGRRGVTGAGFAWRGRSYGGRSRKGATPEPNESA